MKKLQAISLLILGLLISHPDFCLAQKKFMGYPVAEYYDAWIDGWFSERIDQDERGLIYVLTGKTSINIYSAGEHFDSIVPPVGSRYHAIRVGPSGRIYVGGSDLGYYFPGNDGKYEYHSLGHLLPEPIKITNRNYIKTIFQHDGAMVFTQDSTFYFYKDNTISIVSSGEANANRTIRYRGDLYNVTSEGLAVFRDKEWEVVQNGDFFKGMDVVRLFEYSHDTMLVCTHRNGWFLVNDKQVIPFAADAVDFKKLRILSLRQLSDGHFLFGTPLNGLYILNRAGELVYHFNRENLLKPHSQIWNVFEDSFGNIWVVRPFGIFKIEWNSPFSRIDQLSGLDDGYGISAQLIDDQIYLSTSGGLYVGKNEWPLNLRRVEEVDATIYIFRNFDTDWLLGGQYGLYQLTETGVQQVSQTGNWWNLIETRNPNIILGGNYRGIYRIEKSNGLWSELTKYEDSEHVTPLFVFDETERLWAFNTKGVYSFSFTDNYRSIASTHHYDTTKGLPHLHGNVPMKFGDEFLLNTLEGFYEYDRQNDVFKPSKTWNERFGPYAPALRGTETDAQGNIYYLNYDSPYPKRLKRDRWDKYTNEPNLLSNIPIKKGGNRISILDDQNILFPYDKGFVHYDVASQNDGPDKIHLLIHYVKLTRSDSLLFGGHFTNDEEVVLSQPTWNHPVIRYDQNSLAIGYSAVEFNNYSQTYRYQLEGYDEEWSSWTNETEKEFMNLWEGDYTFKVQARTVNGNILPTQTYSFTILPPWYRSWYAYSFYSFAIFGLFGGGFLAYRRKKIKQITGLQKKQLESEVEHKQTELATTAMHLIEKIDFIKSIKARISQILNDEDKDVNRELKRIIREIDRNALHEDIWEDFERHFDAAHTGFLQKLQKAYPTITPQELKLSAYLRMNLSTKEIANLMQITPRSVEVARYRLRKKMELDSEENLAMFMMKY